MILPITEAEDNMKGTTPTASILAGEICVKKIIRINGITLAGIANNRQFKSDRLIDKTWTYNN
jgi:hypothetical protein